MRRAISYVNSGKFRVKTEAEQQIWNECSRLIANAIIYYNTLLLSRVYEQKLAADDQEAIKILRGTSPVAWRDVILIGNFDFAVRRFRRLTSRHWRRVITTRTFVAVLCRKVMMGLLSRGSVQSYFYLFEGWALIAYTGTSAGLLRASQELVSSRWSFPANE